MTDHLLSFELEADGNQLFIHGDPKGLRLWIRSLERLLALAEQGKPDHDHLMSANWGGNELPTAPLSTDDTVKTIDHVKLFGWPDGWGHANENG